VIFNITRITPNVTLMNNFNTLEFLKDYLKWFSDDICQNVHSSSMRHSEDNIGISL